MKIKLYYGWWIVLVAFVSLFLGFGIIVVSFGAFFKALIKEFGGSRAQIAGVLGVCLVTLAIMGPLMGKFTDKWGPKKVMLPGAIVTGVGLMLLYLTTSLWQVYTIYVFLGVGMAALTLVPTQTAVSIWFIKRRGFAMAAALSGIPLGGAVMTPFITYIVSGFGVKVAYLFSGILLCIFVLPLLGLLMKRRPQDIGLMPDGEGQKIPGPEISEVPFVPEGLTRSNAMRTRGFWQLVLLFFVYGITFQSIISHVIPHLTDMGVSPEKAAGTVSLILIIDVLAKFSTGYLVNRFKNQYLFAVCLLILCIGLLSLIGLGKGYVWLFYSFVILFGAGNGALIALCPMIVGRFFGVAHFGEIFGILQTVVVVGTVIGPILTGYIYDLTMSYYGAFLLFAVLSLFGAVTSSFIRAPDEM